VPIEDEAVEWDDLAATDPLWAVLSDPARKGGGWRLEEFLATGERAVSSALRRAEELGVPQTFERALDVGCGVGRITRALAARFGECLGVDVSETMVRHATRINADRPNCSFERLGAGELGELEEESFDLVWCVLVLQHLPRDEAERAIPALVSLVRPRGVAIFQMPYATRALHRLQLARRTYRLLRRSGVSSEFLLRRTPLTPMRMITLSEERVHELVRAGGGQVVAAEAEGDVASPTPSRVYFVSRCAWRTGGANSAVTGAD
jgi:SAM-dependent methyltransferase